MPTASVDQFVDGDFNDIFDQAFFSQFTGFFDVDVVGTPSATSFTVQNNDDLQRLTTFEGTGFTFDVDGNPTGGTIETITFDLDGSGTLATIAGLSISLVDFADALEAAGNGDETLLDAIFAPYQIDYDASTTTGGVTADIASALGDTITGGSGNDTLIGGAGDDVIEGGDGDDFIDPGENTGFGDIIIAGGGSDTVDFGNASPESYYLLSYNFLASGDSIEATIGDLGGSIVKTASGGGTIGTDTLTGLDAISGQSGGFAIQSGSGDDIFNIALSADDVIQIRAGAGSDVINGGEEFTRIRYTGDGFSNGIVVTVTGYDANGSSGTVDQGGGNIDTFSGINEFRGSDGADIFNGGAERDRFITEKGNDIVYGGDGIDMVRYDREGVGPMTIDLGAGTAIGTWDGEAFTDTLDSIEEVRGSAFDDVITGSAADEFLRGQDGNDSIYGGDGIDLLDGGSGNDSIFGGAGDDEIAGGDGDDYIDVGENTGFGDVIIAGAGNDTVDFGSNAAAASFYLLNYNAFGGGAFIEATIGNLGGSVVKKESGGAIIGTDTLAGLDAIDGQSGGLTIRGTAADDTFTISQNADDFLEVRGGGGSDTITGGAEFTRIRYSGDGISNGVVVTVSGYTANGSSGTVDQGGGNVDVFSGVDEFRGSNGDDIFYGGNQRDRFVTEQGNDSVYGGGGVDLIRYDRSGVGAVTVDLGAGSATGTWGGAAFLHLLDSIEQVWGSVEGDTITGSASANTLEGRAGDDTLDGATGNDRLLGGSGNDLILVTEAGIGGDYHDGGDGVDTIDWSALTLTGHIFNLGNGRAFDGLGGVQNMLGFENVIGSQGADDIRGNDSNNTLDGQDGDDFIRDFGGNDLLVGGLGADLLDSGDGNDTLDGGDGDDKLYGRQGDDVAYGGDGDDLLKMEGRNDYAEGGAGNDRMTGNNGFDTLYGGDGNDVVDGGGGDFDDFVYGGAGNDRLFGRDGADLIDGGTGNDRLFGGLGADIFVFRAGEGTDLVLDYENDVDVIDFSEHAGFNSLADVLALAADGPGGRLLIGVPGSADRIYLDNMTVADLDDGDFIFS